VVNALDKADVLAKLPAPGEVIAGKYQIDRVLGGGGMGMVVAATHLTLREPVALKFLHPSLAARPDIVTRFLREAQAAVRIKSEHIARVMDVGQLPSGAPFLVMEMLDGTDFSKLLRQRGPLPVAEVVDAVLQACHALTEAHRLGIVHRDLKPANLFLTHRADGRPLVKVLDFGISKVGPSDRPAAEGADATDERTLTTGEDVLGSPLYMSPEQIKTPHQVDGRADVWSLGTILVRLLTGKSAFQASTPAAILARIVSEEPESVTAHRPDLPAGLDAVIRRCLERDLDKRWPSVEALAGALLPFAPAGAAASVWAAVTSISNPAVSVPPELRAPAATPPAEAASEAPSQKMAPSRVVGESTQAAWSGAAPRKRGGPVLIAAVALAVGGLVVWLAMRPSASAPTPAAAAAPSPSAPASVAARASASATSAGAPSPTASANDVPLAVPVSSQQGPAGVPLASSATEVPPPRVSASPGAGRPVAPVPSPVPTNPRLQPTTRSVDPLDGRL
jgi:serine/threonine protein kinase